MFSAASMVAIQPQVTTKRAAIVSEAAVLHAARTVEEYIATRKSEFFVTLGNGLIDGTLQGKGGC
jgi:hypothetical protein